MLGLLATLAVLVLPVPLELLGLPAPSAQLVQVVLLVPLVGWALLVARGRKV